ncbi:MAG: hypothetical protein FJX23_07950, partial [Alphaproteobacteria bacterium]|nr:hypothetical protein [Alphaproteobacteria bacterium]
MSAFTGQISDAALGRLPTRVVPQAVNAPKAEDRQNSGQQRQPTEQPATATAAGSSTFQALMNAGKGEIKLPSPFSTTFIAQIFGQYDTSSEVGNAVTAIWLSNGRATPKDSGMLEYERIVQQQGMVKYAPSAAKPTVSGSAQALQQLQAQNNQALVFRRNTNKQELSPLFVGGASAYS